jgi:hypothetical protein
MSRWFPNRIPQMGVPGSWAGLTGRAVGGLAALLCSGGIALADGSLEGRWRGKIDCDRKPDLRMELEISSVADGRLTGVLELGTGSRKGALNMTGAVAADGTFELTPGTWIRELRGFSAADMRGKSIRIGKSDGIQGYTTSPCREGLFTAFRQNPVAKPPPAPDMPPPRERDPQVLTEAVRRNVEKLVARGELSDDPWTVVWLSIKGSLVDTQLKEQLLAEVDAARNGVIADKYQGKLAQAPQGFPSGVDVALLELRRAQRAGLKGTGLQELHAAVKARVNAIMEVEFTKAAAILPELTDSLESLIRARAAIAPLEEFRWVIEDRFGVFDPKWILTPLLRRIAELEASPVVSASLRDALAEARRAPDPREATRALLLSVLGPDETGSPLDQVAIEGRGLADIAAIKVVDATSGPTDPQEPTARDIALFSFERWRIPNQMAAALRCGRGLVDEDSVMRCATSDFDIWLTSVTKLGCQAEIPGREYVCEFREAVEAKIRKPVPTVSVGAIWEFLRSMLPNEFNGDLARARFVRAGSGAGEWTVHWGRLTSSIPPVFEAPSRKPSESRADVFPLHQEKRSALHRRNLSGKCKADENQGATGTCKRVFDLVASKSYEVLICSYGPFGEDGGGFEVYMFWSGQAPEELESYRMSATDHPFDNMGKRALQECPADTRELEPIYRDTRL